MHLSIWLVFCVVNLIHRAHSQDIPKPFPIAGCNDEAQFTILCVRSKYDEDLISGREGIMIAPAPRIKEHVRRTCNGFPIRAHTAERAYCCPKAFADPLGPIPRPAFEFQLKEKCKPVRMDWPKGYKPPHSR
ncbi:hypothetical protein MJO29_005422 [Puccinia striiformis f. sp. tritici]|uniref:hypothetical protein n=1 Tax=Puccinia striiformis f. sp. tritici TaxID=168172 RepID=UPI0020074E4F|nr:hypothetical protein Pst134EA_009521 [Puccinia striiformis f. sp. tritici]KAH9469001.1 hypothetical protein Pst134EA_009521 [Puccinia striiformis f. sp. tritici]KAI7960354.1 hypothetical protein MJO29_005422 [Puccinia striiformis f. sp. tritici]